jgi:hypothetical protein
MTEENPVAQEWRLRAVARRRGWRLTCRTPDAYADAERLWSIVDSRGNPVVGGQGDGLDLTIDEVERYLDDNA